MTEISEKDVIAIADQELEASFKLGFSEETTHYSKMFNEFTEPANDKKFATGMALGILTFVLAFKSSSKLTKEILEGFDFAYKLGQTLPAVIRGIPEFINKYRKEEAEFHKEYIKRRKKTFHFKKFLGIPYGIEGITVHENSNVNPYLFGSAFDSCTSELEIANELGKLVALIKLQEELGQKYIELGGTFGEEEGNLPVDFLNAQMMSDALRNNNLDVFFRKLQELFASMPYDIKTTEADIHSNVHMMLKFLEIPFESESQTNIGRIDMVILVPNFIYIIEFKLDAVTDFALEQIKTKKYFQKYQMDTRQIVLVGVSINSKERNIQDWKSEPLIKLAN